MENGTLCADLDTGAVTVKERAMDDKRLAELRQAAAQARERADKATPGPWLDGIMDPTCQRDEFMSDLLRRGGETVWLVVPKDHSEQIVTHPDGPQAPPHYDNAVVPAVTGNGPTSETNAAFIAASRTDVPALAAAVEELANDNERLRGIIERAGAMLDGAVMDRAGHCLKARRILAEAEASNA